MRHEKDFTEKVKILVDFIKDPRNQDEDGWVLLKYNMVNELTDISPYYTKKVIALLKDHPNIAFELSKDYKLNNKPMVFKYVEPEEKINMVLTEDSFLYLTQENIDFIKDRVEYKDYHELLSILNYANFLVSMKADKDFVKIYPRELSNALVEPTDVINDYENRFKQSGLLIDKNGMTRVILDSADESTPLLVKNHEKNADIPTEKDIFVTTNNDSDESISSKGLVVEHDESLLQSDLELDPKESISYHLTSFFNSVSDMNQSFENFIAAQVDKAIKAEQENDKLEKDREVLDKLLEENQSLRTKISNLEQQNNKIKNQLKHLDDFQEGFIMNIQNELDYMLAQISSQAKNFAELKRWELKPNSAKNFEIQITSIVKNSVNDMINFKLEEN